MTKKLFIASFFIGGAILIFLISAFDLSYSVDQEGRSHIQVDNQLIIAHEEIFGTLERPAVIFNHGLHVMTYREEGCSVCHPMSADETLMFDFPFKAETKSREGIMDSYHNTCIGCHKERFRLKKKTGPTRCGACHRKQVKSASAMLPVCDFDFSLHGKHVKTVNYECGFCHHSYDKEDGELVYERGAEQSCYYCHDLEAKRGPFLASEIEVTRSKILTMKKVSHNLCVNCHLIYSEQQSKAGPIECAQCHTGKYKTLAELRNVPRPDRDQPSKPIITVEGGMMKGVLFDHTSHEKSSVTCRACHHETLTACKRCHTVTGSPEGNWLTTANAFHSVSSKSACAGCHAQEKSRKECAGCHHHFFDADIQSKGPKKQFCTVCHSGGTRSHNNAQKIPLARLVEGNVPDKVTIDILANEYQPATFPHREIIGKLIDISNRNRMAATFHRNIDNICRGCHHQSVPEAEAGQRKPPFCRNCHSLAFDAQNMNRPRLLAAYHRQCLGCHERMQLTQTGCGDCHEKKAGVSAGIFFPRDSGRQRAGG